MNKKLITLAVAAAITAPAAAFAEATIYGVLHNHLDYVDVDQNTSLYGPGSVPGVGVSVPLQPDNYYITPVLPPAPNAGAPQTITGVPGGTDTTYVLTESGTLVSGNLVSTSVDATNGTYVDQNGMTQQLVAAPNGGWLVPGGLIPKAQDFKGWGLNANDPANRVGIKGSEDLGGGLKAIYQVELGISLSNITGDGYIANGDRVTANGNRAKDGVNVRNSFVGLAGNFGTFLVGRHDTPLKISTGKLDLFADTLADYNYTIGFQDVRADSTVAYISPSFSGFQFAGAVIPSLGATPIGWGVPGDAPDGIADAYSLALIYSNGPFYAGAGYESLGQDHWNGFNSPVTVNGVTTNEYNGIANYGSSDDWNKWRIGLGLLDWNGFSLTGVYENNSNVLGAPSKSDMKLWQVQAAYAFGNNTIKAMYGQNDVEECVGSLYSNTCGAAQAARYGSAASSLAYLDNRDYNSWAVAFDHNFSKRTQAYALYTATDADQVNSDWSGFSLGLKHKF